MGVQTAFGAARPEAARQDRVLNVSTVVSNLPDGGRGIGQLFVSTSIGVTVCSGDDADIDEPISGTDFGVEAWLRWTRPTGPNIGPDKFVPILEEIGLIVPVGAWVALPLKNVLHS